MKGRTRSSRRPGASTADHPLELDGPDMRAMIARATEHVVRFVETLPAQPMHRTRGAKKVARALRQDDLPEEGTDFEALCSLLFGRVLPAALNTASGGYLGYIPGGGIFHAAVADFMADATNRYVGVFVAAPGLVQIEANVVAWFARMLGLPTGSGGILTSGGSMANLVAVVTARRERLPPDFLRGVVYTSDEAHHSVRKAASLAGILPEHVRSLPTDTQFRMRPDALEAAITTDRADGLMPFLLVASAGTTGTGAVDDIAQLAPIAAQHGLWLHVDAAYGGFFALTERGHAALRGIELADSITLDPHKGLFLPYGTGSLVVRDRSALHRTHAIHATYLPRMQEDDDLVDFCDLGPELSRDARGLRVWLPIAMHGARVFRAELDEKLDLAAEAARAVAALPDVELVSAPALSLFAFRARPPHLGRAERDRYNRRWMSLVNQRQRVLLTGTTAAGEFALRICVLSFRTHREHIAAAIADLTATLDELRGRDDRR